MGIGISAYQQKPLVHQGIKEGGRFKVRWIDLFLALIGLLLGQATFIQGLAPFGVAFLLIFINIHPQRLTLIALGVGAGSVIGRGWTGLGIILVVALGIYLVRLLDDKISHKAMKGAVVSGLVLGFHILRFLIDQSDLYPLIMGILDASLIFLIGWLFIEGLTGLVIGTENTITRNNVLALLFVLTGILSGIPELTIMGVKTTPIIMKIILLVIAYVGGITEAMVLGLSLGLALTLTGLYEPAVLGLYGFIGLTAGFFKEYGRIAVMLGMLFAMMIFAGLEIVMVPIEYLLLDSMIAGVIFLIIPKQFLNKIGQYMPNANPVVLDKGEGQVTKQDRFSERLDEFSQFFSELSATFGEVASGEEVEEDDLSYFLYIISNRVCKGCNYESYCWDKQFYQTYSQIFKLLSLIESKGQVESQEFVHLLKGHCRNLSRLKEYVDGSLEIYQLHRHWNSKLKDHQVIVADQLGEISTMFKDFSNELELSVTAREEREKLLKERLEENGLDVISCHVAGSAEEDFLEVTITKEKCSGQKECRRIFHQINRIISQPITKYDTICGCEQNQKFCRLTMAQTRKLKIDVGFCNHPQNGQVSGDTLVYQQLKSGKFMTLLSDGMGKGEEAAQESRTLARLVKKIIRAGFSHDLAVRTVNTALNSRSTGECFATMDLSFIDLFNGEVEFVKIGAAASFIKRGHEVNLIRGCSLPVGILESVEPATFKRKLIPGDFVIMMSDGILDSRSVINKEEWMAQILRKCSFDSSDQLAEYIYEQAVGNGPQEDDMSVVVLKLSEEN